VNLRRRYDELERATHLLLSAHKLIQEAAAQVPELRWLVDSAARAIRETNREMNDLLEGER
jgi:hypothetical protein